MKAPVEEEMRTPATSRPAAFLTFVSFCSELEESLLVLPFSYVPDILRLCTEFMQLGSDVELLCRCLFFLLR